MMTKDGVPGVNPKLDAMGEMLKTIHDLKERNKRLTEENKVLLRMLKKHGLLEQIGELN